MGHTWGDPGAIQEVKSRGPRTSARIRDCRNLATGNLNPLDTRSVWLQELTNCALLQTSQNPRCPKQAKGLE